MVTPVDTDPIALDIHEIKEAKAQRLILDGIRDHLIPQVAEKKIAYNMWTTLFLYEAKNEKQIMALKENKLWIIVISVVTPPETDPVALDIHEVKEAKAHRLILNGIRDILFYM